MFNYLFKISISLLTCFSMLAVADVTEHEPNNTLADAFAIRVNAGAKIYKFDYQGDEDWFVFIAQKGIPYNIEIPDSSVGKGINPAITIYNSQGEIEVAQFDFGFKGEGELLAWDNVPKSDFYYIKITNKEPSFSVDAHYDLKVFIPFAPQTLSIDGKVLDQCTNKELGKAHVLSSSGDETYTASKGVDIGNFGMVLDPGSYTLTATWKDYLPQNLTVTETRLQEDTIVIPLEFKLMPRSGCTSTEPPPVIVQPIIDPAKQVAEFDANTRILVIKDVRIGGGPIIAVELQLQDANNFKLTKANPIATALFDAPANYDFETGRGIVPRVFYNNQVFSIKLLDKGNGIFALDGEPVPVQ